MNALTAVLGWAQDTTAAEYIPLCKETKDAPTGSDFQPWARTAKLVRGLLWTSTFVLRVIDECSGKKMGTVRRLLIRGGIKSAWCIRTLLFNAVQRKGLCLEDSEQSDWSGGRYPGETCYRAMSRWWEGAGMNCSDPKLVESIQLRGQLYDGLGVGGRGSVCPEL